MLTQLIYTSLAIRHMRESDLEAILEVSRLRNANLGITGLLAYFGPSREFIQLLEGAEQDVHDLYYGSILSDARHRNVETFYVGTAPQRLCCNWSMAYHSPRAASLAEAADRSDYLDGGGIGTGQDTWVRRLMLRYRDEILGDRGARQKDLYASQA